MIFEELKNLLDRQEKYKFSDDKFMEELLKLSCVDELLDYLETDEEDIVNGGQHGCYIREN